MFKTLVWATDGSESADRALPYVKSLAAQNNAAVIVVHSIDYIVGRAGAHLEHIDEEELKAKIERQVAELAGAGLDARLEIVGAARLRPAHMIADVAQDVAADLIVVGTRGHAPMTELLLGSVTQRLLHIAHCPVLAVPPVKQAGDAPPAMIADSAATP